MEDIVNSCRRRQLKLISNSPNALDHFEWPKESECKLVVGSGSQRRLHIGLKLHKDEVTYYKLSFEVVLVSLVFDSGSCTEEMLLHHCLHELTVLHLGMKI
jgi:hypothetical protein